MLDTTTAAPVPASGDLIPPVAAAVALLDLPPRGARWTTLSACVLDAVWSLGSKYDSVVSPLVHRVLTPVAAGPLIAPEPPAVDPYSLARFLEQFPDEQALLAVSNGQLTSTRNGITKAEAALRFAQILIDHEIGDLLTATEALADPAAIKRVDRALRAVPGDGQFGIRRSYFWMLCGDDYRIKPDRMVMRWLAPFGVSDPARAHALLVEVAQWLSARPGSPRITPWQVDHAIWLAARTPKKKRPS